jgi:sialate O-acetylesterase
MKNLTIKNKALLAGLMLVACMPMRAEVKLPAIFADGMVMQQQTKANLWGTATPSRRVTVVGSWDNRSYTATADKQGSWKLSIATPAAGGPYTLTFNDGTKKTLHNILVGELWLCSGQSNMEMPMKGYKNQPVAHANMDILRSTNPQIRLFTVKHNAIITPQNDVTGTWSEAKPETVRGFSATAYYFGRLLNEILKVPVGLVVSSWGGSSCEAWMRADWLRAFPDAKIPQSQAEIQREPNRIPVGLYNGMIHPLIGMTMRGVIWYQGESNYDRANTYADMFAAMIKGWRAEWNEGDFPFYYCQIAPYDYSLITAKGKPVINSAYLREAQAKVELSLPNTGMAVLLDAGLEKGIHPLKKRVAGERLALLALTKTYGIKGVVGESPYYKGMTVKNDTVTVAFERAGMWINGNGSFESKNFEVAGADRVFYPAKAWISRSKVLVKSEQVPHPVAVRYAFKNYVVGDLFCEGLPVGSFRSDNW